MWKEKSFLGRLYGIEIRKCRWSQYSTAFVALDTHTNSLPLMLLMHTRNDIFKAFFHSYYTTNTHVTKVISNVRRRKVLVPFNIICMSWNLKQVGYVQHLSNERKKSFWFVWRKKDSNEYANVWNRRRSVWKRYLHCRNFFSCCFERHFIYLHFSLCVVPTRILSKSIFFPRLLTTSRVHI